VFLQHGQGYNAFTAGELILPQALVMLVTIPLSGMLYDRVGPRALGAIGFSLLVAGDALFTGITPDMTRAEVIAWSCARGAGIGIGVMPIMTWGISRVTTSSNDQANALFNVAQQVGGALGLAALGTFITTRQVDLLTARTNLLGPDSELARRAGTLLAHNASTDRDTFATLYRLAERLQIDVMATTYRQMFVVLGAVTAAAGFLTLLLRHADAPVHAAPPNRTEAGTVGIPADANRFVGNGDHPELQPSNAVSADFIECAPESAARDCGPVPIR
jgi:MFS family permease